MECPSGVSDLSLIVSKDSRHLAWHEDKIGIIAVTVGITETTTHKRAHENYCFSSPFLQPPPTLQIATEDHLQDLVAGFWVRFFLFGVWVWVFGCFGSFFFFFFPGWKSKQGRKIFAH